MTIPDLKELSGGALVYSGTEAALGITGLLVQGAGGSVMALTHALVLAERALFAPSQGDADAMSPDCLCEVDTPYWRPPANSISTLIGASPVPPGMKVSHLVAGLPGLGEIAEPLPPVEAVGSELLLAANGSATTWRITSINGWASFVGEGGQPTSFNDVVECAPLEAISEDPPLGGAVFFTDSGAPVAMLVGWRGDIALAAPLRPVLWQNHWEPLTQEAAAAHNHLNEVASAPSAAGAATAPAWLRGANPRSRSYRFAVIPMREVPSAEELRGCDDLKDVIQPGTYRNRTGFSATALKRWLLASLRRHENAASLDEMADAFHPLVLVDPDRPAREVLAAVDRIDPFKQEQLVDFAVERLEGAVPLERHEERALLWWFIHEFLARHARGTPSFDIITRVYHALSLSQEAVLENLADGGATRPANDELFAMIEAMCALPPTRSRDVLLETVVRGLAFDPEWQSFAATRLLLLHVKETRGSTVSVFNKHADLVNWAIADAAPSREELEHLVGLILRTRHAPDAELAAMRAALAAIEAHPFVSPMIGFEETRDRQQSQLRSAIRELVYDLA